MNNVEHGDLYPLVIARKGDRWYWLDAHSGEQSRLVWQDQQRAIEDAHRELRARAVSD